MSLTKMTRAQSDYIGVPEEAPTSLTITGTRRVYLLFQTLIL
ncbi:MAG: hypothetical protein IPI37_04790 [Bacteroidales bacterium]|nr:hypothetical protein [Bacteroidales bacterium]